jgi:hypothetical protein
MHAFVARDLQPVPRNLQPGERIEVEVHAPEAIERMIADGAIEDGKSIAAFALWKAVRA